MASVSVTLEGKVIHATYVGTMTMDLVKDGERQIEALLAKVQLPAVLYDTRAMATPTVGLALEMKNFDSRIAKKISRSATVVNDAGTAFCAKIAFVFSPEHKVFYHDVESAMAWLGGAKVASAV